MKNPRFRLRILSVALALVLFGFSANGFFSVVNGDRWYPKNSDVSDIRCNVQKIESGNQVRFIAARCDEDKFYMATLNGGTDWKQEITKDEYLLRAQLAQRMGEGWSYDIALDDPRVQDFLEK